MEIALAQSGPAGVGEVNYMGVVAARRVAARMNRSHNPTLNADAISKHAVRTGGGENEPPATTPHSTPTPSPSTRGEPQPQPHTQRRRHLQARGANVRRRE